MLLDYLVDEGSSRFSISPNNQSARIDISEIGITAAMMIEVPSDAFTPRCNTSPSQPAPTNVPIVEIPIPVMKALRIPPIITESASGNSTL